MHLALKSLTICAALVVTTLPARADKTLFYQAEAESKAQPMTILVQPPNIRLETGDYVLLYDAVADQSIVMDVQKRAYYRMTRERATELAEQIQAAQEQMQQMLEQAKAGMSEEQRAQLEQYMSSSGIGAMGKPRTIALRSSGRRGEFYAVECEWVELLTNGQTSSEMCIADATHLDMDEAERRAVNKMADLLLTVGNQLSQASLERRPDGIPIAMYDYRENHRIHLDNITEQSLDPSLFEVPKDYKLMSIVPGG